MKNTVITSILATFVLSFFAFFNNVPKNLIKNKMKLTKNKRTKPIIEFNDDNSDWFI